MFYLKYRPKTIEELDNTRVKDVIAKILTSSEIPHALLFTGAKGTGKTSAARIFAKAINCLKNKFSDMKTASVEPCNTCANCVSISSSSSVDVTEMDAASNRGIDDIRTIIKESAFLPMTARYRIFIIDEAHMITNEAFNALLKTLEEPPSATIFILATTNEEKIPKTIASRCTKIQFGKAKKADLVVMLERITRHEKLRVEKSLLTFIADNSDLSFRDAAKLLEELATQNKLSLPEAKRFVGIIRQDLLGFIENRDVKGSYLWIDEFNQQGGSFKQIIEDLLSKLRLALLKINGVPIEEEIDTRLSLEEITLLIKLFTEAYQTLKISPIESLPLEIAITEFYNKIKVNN